jgi:hypothetical protein
MLEDLCDAEMSYVTVLRRDVGPACNNVALKKMLPHSI